MKKIIQVPRRPRSKWPELSASSQNAERNTYSAVLVHADVGRHRQTSKMRGSLSGASAWEEEAMVLQQAAALSLPNCPSTPPRMSYQGMPAYRRIAWRTEPAEPCLG
ncbi:MAG: hypothetical protein FRX48_01819 [Lasallia pustulata]|uniref:Uncharacterized protein n=1 Tax=Lasallia pustulata TaxID=136370 RepID=A0A5M8Q051_9LECA|nr:MAG: hypothetical protein FRX48_01819 [Lasallia pustulata]